MEATLSNFRTLFPEFDDPVLSDSKVELYLEQASEIHSCSGTAQLYLAAHLAAMDLASDGQAPEDAVTVGEGFAKTQKVGDLSLTLADLANPSDGEYMRTKYGRKYVQFRDAALASARFPRVMC